MKHFLEESGVLTAGVYVGGWGGAEGGQAYDSNNIFDKKELVC